MIKCQLNNDNNLEHQKIMLINKTTHKLCATNVIPMA